MEPLFQLSPLTPRTSSGHRAPNVVGKSRRDWSLLLTTTCLSVPTGRCTRDMTSHTVDQKLLFESYNGVPGIGARRFRKNIILHGGNADEVRARCTAAA